MTRQHSGTGLGLAICKQLVEKMKGQIGLESIQKEGSIFWFAIPLSVGESNQVGTTHQRPLSQLPKFEGEIVLLVEDNPTNQKVVLEYLALMQIKVDIAPNGQIAVHMVKQCDYDLILMDCRMPVMNGLEATQKIRQLNQKENIPIIAMTASILDDARQKCLFAGMNDYLPKPFQEEELISILNRWLNNAKDEQLVFVHKSGTSSSNSPTDTASLIDLNLIKGYSIENPTFILDILETYVAIFLRKSKNYERHYLKEMKNWLAFMPTLSAVLLP